jgi:hypothetical protein
VEEQALGPQRFIAPQLRTLLRARPVAMLNRLVSGVARIHGAILSGLAVEYYAKIPDKGPVY